MNSKGFQRKREQFGSILLRLQQVCDIESPSSFERDSIILRFELCFELAWKSLQAYLAEQGYAFSEGKGPLPTLRMALAQGLIASGDLWTEMHSDRNLATHVYYEELAAALSLRVRDHYLPALQQLQQLFTQL